MDTLAPSVALPSEARQFGFFLNGTWEPGGSRDVIERNSPAHGAVVTKIVRCTRADVDTAVASARAAFAARRWSGIPSADRAEVLLKAAEGIRSRSEEIALLETLENGKPISQSRSEVLGAAGIYEYAAGAARALHGESFNNLGDAMLGLVTREPVGVVGLITPWNFPFFIFAERLPFILASGCTVVAKPSELTSATTLIMAEILSEAGLPPGVLSVLTGKGSEIGQAMTEHPDIDMLSFTGSTGVGRAAVSASVGNLKRLSLELGGKNPQIVFADADLQAAADGVVFAICFNAGQCCVSGSRLLVEASVAARFEVMLAEKFAKVRIGDPLDPSTQIGAITSQAQYDTISHYLAAGKSEGARLVFGGEAIRHGAGMFMGPTLFADVSREMKVVREEIFGPILTMSTFTTFDQAMSMANDTEYGLAATIWSSNLECALRAAQIVQAGRVWINTTISGGPELPSGGFKQSGQGREAGIYGVEEYTNVKSTHIAFGPRSPWVG